MALLGVGVESESLVFKRQAIKMWGANKQMYNVYDRHSLSHPTDAKKDLGLGDGEYQLSSVALRIHFDVTSGSY